MDVSGVKIQPMTDEYIRTAVELCVGEGWNVDANMLQGSLQTFPEGSWAAILDNQLIGYCSADFLNEEHGFICYFVVKKQCRGTGIGGKLLSTTIKALGDRNVSLFSTVDAIPIYKKKYGFKGSDPPVTVNVWRFIPYVKDTEDSSPDINVSAITMEDLDSLTEYDKTIHIIERKRHIKQYIQDKDYGVVARNKLGQICGYAFVKKGPLNTKLMPLYAEDTTIAKKLFKYVIGRLPKDEVLQVLFPEVNQTVRSFYSEFGLPAKPNITVELLWTKSRFKVAFDKVYSVMSLSNTYV